MSPLVALIRPLCPCSRYPRSRLFPHVALITIYIVVLGIGGSTATKYDNTTTVTESRRVAAQKLTVAAVLEEPYVMMRSNAVFLTGNDRFEGFLVDVLRQVAEGAGFDYEICLSTDGRYGDVNEAGQWDGIIGEVARRERDLAIGPLVINQIRRQVIDFTEPFLSIRSSALVLMRPSVSASSSTRLRTPTTTSTQLPPPSLPLPSTAGKHILLSSDLTFGVVRDGAARRQLETSGDPLIRAAWARLIGFWPSAVVGTVDEGIDRTRRSGGRFLLVADSPAIEYAASRYPCDLGSTEPFLDRADYAFAVARDASPSSSDVSGSDNVETVHSRLTEGKSARLRRSIDRQLVRLRRDSTLTALYLKWWRSECSVVPALLPVSIASLPNDWPGSTGTGIKQQRHHSKHNAQSDRTLRQMERSSSSSVYSSRNLSLEARLMLCCCIAAALSLTS